MRDSSSPFVTLTPWRILMVAMLLLLLTACDKEQPPPTFDHAADPLPFPRPAIAQLDILPGTAPIPDDLKILLDARRAFFAGDFVQVENFLRQARADYLAGPSAASRAGALINSIEETQMAGLGRCANWLEIMPASYHAHWLCAGLWQAGAWAARSNKTVDEINSVQFALMRERLQQSNRLLERALTLTDTPLEALTNLAANHALAGDRAKSEEYLIRAEAIMPRHAAIHRVRMDYLLPEWGGEREQVLAAFEHAKALKVDEAALLDMEDSYIVRPWRMSTPGAAKAYWESAIKRQPTQQRLSDLTKHLIWVQNWQAALPAATQLIEAYPNNAEGRYQRARVHEALGNISEARDDYRMAAAMGHNLALQTLIMAHVRGGLGLSRDYQQIFELCRYGATLGVPVAANCLGASFFEGGSDGIPFPHDVPQAFAWHLMAARAGHFNSQYDLGWSLYTRGFPGIAPEQAHALGVFWMRRAAEQGHHFAKEKLVQNEIGLSEEMPHSFWDGPAVQYVLDILYGLIRILM